MKFRSIGIRGPWTSGGIEHNFGLDLGHAPWAAAPVDYLMKENADGSVSCIVGGIDLASRTQWRVNILCPKTKPILKPKACGTIPLPYMMLIYPGKMLLLREPMIYSSFPWHLSCGARWVCASVADGYEGRDLSWYKNNDFGGHKSYHVVGTYTNWFGGYWHDEDFGFGHWAPYSDAPGKKIWIWSLARDGAIWEDLLTDTDGQYIEAQSGVKLNQAGETSGFHSPLTSFL